MKTRNGRDHAHRPRIRRDVRGRPAGVAKIDVDAYLGLLALDGTLVNVGAPAEPLSIDVFSLIMSRRSFAGSLIGGIAETQEMLDFCAAHGVGAEVEVIPAAKISEAFERVLASDVRYRFVIDASTFGVN